MTSNMDEPAADFMWQPVRDVQTLVDWIGLPPMRRGADLADAVVFADPNGSSYVAAVAGHEVRYDGTKFPGMSGCDCTEAYETALCAHVAAVALLVLGRGRVPRVAAGGFRGMKRGYPEGFPAMGFGFPATLRRTVDGGPMSDGEALALRESALARVRAAAGSANRFRDEVRATCSAAARLHGAGRPGEAVRLLHAALPVAREVGRRLLDDAARRAAPGESIHRSRSLATIPAIVNDIVAELVEVRPERNPSMLAWVEGIIDGERDDEVTIRYSQLWVLLDDDQLAELAGWLDHRGDRRRVNWDRRLAITAYLGDREGYRRLIAEAPEGAHEMVMRHHRESPPTAESVAILAGLLDRGLVVAHLSSTTEVAVADVVEWLGSSSRDDAEALLRRIAVECFDDRLLWDSVALVVRAFGSDDVARFRALELAGVRGDGLGSGATPEERLAAVIIDAQTMPPDRDLELVGVATAETFVPLDAAVAAQHMAGRFPATAANLATAAAYRAQGHPLLLPTGEILPSLSWCATTVADARRRQGASELYWDFLADLMLRGPIDDEDRELLKLRGLWPVDDRPAEDAPVDDETAGDQTAGDGLAGDAGEAGTSASTAPTPAYLQRAARRVPRPSLPDPLPAGLHPQLATAHVATLEDVRALGFTGGAAFFGPDGRLDGFLTDVIDGGTGSGDGAGSGESLHEAWAAAARRFPATGLWPLRIAPIQYGLFPSFNVHAEGEAAYAIAPDPLWAYFMPGRHHPEELTFTIDDCWEGIAGNVGWPLHRNLAEPSAKPADLRDNLKTWDEAPAEGKLLLVACHRPSDVPWILDFGLPGGKVTPGLFTGVLRSWEERFAVVPERLWVGGTEFQCLAPPQADADRQKLTEEIFFFADDSAVNGLIFHEGDFGMDAIGGMRRWIIGWV